MLGVEIYITLKSMIAKLASHDWKTVTISYKRILRTPYKR